MIIVTYDNKNYYYKIKYFIMLDNNFDTFYFQHKKEIEEKEWQILEGKKLKEFEVCCSFLWNFNKEIQIEKISEQPDFILNIEDRKIWLEIVEITPNESIRKKEWSQEKLLNYLESYFKERKEFWNFLAICYLKTFSFRKNDNNIIIEKLKNELISYYKDFVESNKVYLHIKNLKSEYLKSICFQKHSQIDIIGGTWSFWVNNLSQEILLKTIQDKDEKLKKYNKNVDENILLLFIDKSKSSSYQSLEDIENMKISSSFDKVFLYSRFWNHLIPLK